MDRQRLYRAWGSYYAFKGSQDPAYDVLAELGKRAESIRARMVRLAGFPDRQYHGFVRKRLEVALGMSLGIHRQLSCGVGILALGGYNGRVEGGYRRRLEPVRASIKVRS